MNISTVSLDEASETEVPEAGPESKVAIVTPRHKTPRSRKSSSASSNQPSIASCFACQKTVPGDLSICPECGTPMIQDLDDYDYEEEKRILRAKLAVQNGESPSRKTTRLRNDLAFCLYRQAMRIRHNPEKKMLTYELLKEAHFLCRDNPEIAIKLAWISIALNRFSEVETTLKRFLSGHHLTISQRRRVLTNLACAINLDESRKKRFVVAESYARDGLRIEETCQLYENLGAALEGQDRLQEAVEAYKRACELDPSRFFASTRLDNIKTTLKLRRRSTGGDLLAPKTQEPSTLRAEKAERRKSSEFLTVNSASQSDMAQGLVSPRKTSLTQRLKDAFRPSSGKSYYDEF